MARKVYDKPARERYLNIKINTYILRRIYFLMKRQKNEKFHIINRKYKKWGMIVKGVTLNDVRINRIIWEDGDHGYAEYVDTMAKAYHLSPEYFKVDGKMLELKDFHGKSGITIKEWREFLSWRGKQYYVENVSDGYAKRIDKKIDDNLKEIIKAYFDDSLSYEDPLYGVCYYYHKGVYFQGNDMKNLMENFRNRFRKTTFIFDAYSPFAAKMSKYKNIVILTGAGISAESGLAPFEMKKACGTNIK